MLHSFPFKMLERGKKTNGQFNSSRMDYLESFTGEKLYNFKYKSDTKYLHMSGCCSLAQS